MMAEEKTGEFAKFIDLAYQQASEYLLHTIENIKSLKNKATLLLGFLLSVIAFAIPIIFRQNDDYTMSFKLLLAIIVVIYIIVSILLIYGVILPINDHKISGNRINDLIGLTEKHDIKNVVAQSHAMRLLARVTLDYQEKIYKNIKIADKKDIRIRWSLLIVIGSPLILGGVFYLLPVLAK